MLEQLEKTYEYLPRQIGEESRDIIVTRDRECINFKLRLTLAQKVCAYDRKISLFEYEAIGNIKKLEDAIIDLLCLGMKEYLDRHR